MVYKCKPITLSNYHKLKSSVLLVPNIPTAIMEASMTTHLAVEEKGERKKVKKGWVAVRVEGDEYGMATKFMIPITHLYHPEFKKLLHKLEEIDGFCTEGPLSLPISVDDFLHLRWMVEREFAHGLHLFKLCS